ELIAALRDDGFDVQSDAGLAKIAQAAGISAAKLPERINQWRPTARSNGQAAEFAALELGAPPATPLPSTDAVVDVRPHSKRAADVILGLPAGSRNVCFARVHAATKKKDGFECKTFKDRAALIAHLDAHQGNSNCYFSLNPLLRPIAKKAERADVARVVALH